MHDDTTATDRARNRFALQVRLAFIAMLGLCVTMLVIHG